LTSLANIASEVKNFIDATFGHRYKAVVLESDPSFSSAIFAALREKISRKAAKIAEFFLNDIH